MYLNTTNPANDEQVWRPANTFRPGQATNDLSWNVTHDESFSLMNGLHDDDDVSFDNGTASTWTLATPRTTWESIVAV